MPGTSHVGKAGQLAVMSEFLLRGYNVAMPEVDVGDDIFVVHDKEGDLYRIQVKTASGIQRMYGYSGRFRIPLKQLELPTAWPSHYVFVLRKKIGIWDFLVIQRESLWDEVALHDVGSKAKDHVILYFSFKEAEVRCSGRSFQQFRSNWDRWPITDY